MRWTQTTVPELLVAGTSQNVGSKHMPRQLSTADFVARARHRSFAQLVNL